MGTWHITPEAWKGHSARVCRADFQSRLCPGPRHTRDVPTALTLTSHLTLASHVSLSLCLPSGQGGTRVLSVVSSGEATLGKWHLSVPKKVFLAKEPRGLAANSAWLRGAVCHPHCLLRFRLGELSPRRLGVWQLVRRGWTTKLVVIIIKFRCSGFSFSFSRALNILTNTWNTGDSSSIVTPAGGDQGSDKPVAISNLISVVPGACGQS